jgi:hypothetical protein
MRDESRKAYLYGTRELTSSYPAVLFFILFQLMLYFAPALSSSIMHFHPFACVVAT